MTEEKIKIIPMTFDKVFKSVLQDKEQEEYLVDIISNITGIEKEDIRDNIIFKNTEFTKEGVSEKGRVADLIIDIGNNVINLEMNKKLYLGLIDKNDRYIYKIRQGYVSKDEKELIFSRIIQINFDNYELFDERVIIKFEMIDKERGLVRNGYVETSNIEIYHINLKRIERMYYNKEKLSEIEKELLVMTLDDENKLKEVTNGNEKLEKVAKKIVTLSREEELQGIYIKEEQDEWIRNRYKEEGLRDGRKQGLEEGRKEGHKEGKEQGKKEGINENMKKIINNSFDNGLDIKTICLITGLSQEEVYNIKDE